jgi:hypothetical protein
LYIWLVLLYKYIRTHGTTNVTLLMSQSNGRYVFRRTTAVLHRCLNPFRSNTVLSRFCGALHLDCHFRHLMTFYPTPWIRELLLLTACSRVLLEKLTGSQLVNKFPAFHATRRFITAVTTARHLTLYQVTELLAQIIRRGKNYTL